MLFCHFSLALQVLLHYKFLTKFPRVLNQSRGVYQCFVLAFPPFSHCKHQNEAKIFKTREKWHTTIFWSVNSVRSTHSLVKIYNTLYISLFERNTHSFHLKLTFPFFLTSNSLWPKPEPIFYISLSFSLSLSLSLLSLSHTHKHSHFSTSFNFDCCNICTNINSAAIIVFLQFFKFDTYF